MTEEFEIECPYCGVLYSNFEAACPYCGQDQPFPDDISALSDDVIPYGIQNDVEEFYDGEEDEGYYEREKNYEGEAGYENYEIDGAYDYDGSEGYDEYENYPASYPVGDDGYVEYADENGPTEYDSDYNTPYSAGDMDYWFEDEAYQLELEDEVVAAPHRFTKRRVTLGCLGVLLCIGLFYGAIGLIAAYQGLQEQASTKRAEAEQHYQRGQENLNANSLELAIAEFELAVSLNPGLLEAREALREAKRLAQAQPTPTSETRSAAAASILEEAEAQISKKNWTEATKALSQLRDLDPDYQAKQVSELLYTANYQLGLQLTTPDQIEEALLAFERALVERPEDPEAIVERTKASLYVEGQKAEAGNRQKAVASFSQLYQEDNNYLDVKERLIKNRELLGDELAAQEGWCSAETQYLEANRLSPSTTLRAKMEKSNRRCQESAVAQGSSNSPQAALPDNAGEVVTATEVATTTPAVASVPSNGSIYFSAFNQNEKRWEVLSIPANGGTPQVVAINGTMPAVSPDGHWLVYHSELRDAEGLHRLDLTNGEDARITLYQRHILPRMAGNNTSFIMVAQEPGTERWQILQGFIDGKSEPIIIRDGRTPDWSPQGDLIAYQGADPIGNNPGIYLVPFGGGEEARLTHHESDRSPDFSPDGSQIAYMSTQGGNWDIYIVNTAGGDPRQITTSSSQEGLPVWSPDGAQIAYVSDAGGSWAIYVINAAGGAPVKVTAWDGVNMPNWLMTQIWWAR